MGIHLLHEEFKIKDYLFVAQVSFSLFQELLIDGKNWPLQIELVKNSISLESINPQSHQF